jgi:hypothetical protein
VAAEDGLKPIEEIEVGDKVWAMDPESGEMALKEVLTAYKREIDKLYIIKIEAETIETTREHPFWIQGKGWVEAGNLVEGDEVITRQKRESVINRITVKTGEYKVYNLKVRDIHTYLVGEVSALVHNSCDEDELLYRGAPSHTERGRLARRGIVEPRGTSRDYLAHVRGEDVATDVTSWTTSRREARRFGDITLVVRRRDVANRIVPHPAPGLYMHENEVLIRGRLYGVRQYE